MKIYEKEFYDILKLKKIDDKAAGMFFDSIVNHIQHNTNEELEKIVTKKYAFIFKLKEIRNQESKVPFKILTYVIGDERLQKNVAIDFLLRVLALFEETFGDKLNMVAKRIKSGSGFDEKVEEIFGDVYAKAIDRIMNVFF